MHDRYDLNTATRGHLSDGDRVADCLCSAKERAKMYASAALECTNNGVREFFLAMHGEESHNQEILFSFLHTRGHYPVKMAPEERIREVRQRFQEQHDRMGLTDEPSFRRYQTADPRNHPAQDQNPDHFQAHH
jgi:spore coat protein CotF